MGTVLTTFTCTDPDSPGSALDFQLLSHSPPGPASLCLRNRVLEVPSPFPVPLLHAWDKKGGRLRVSGSLSCGGEGDVAGASPLCSVEKRVRAGWLQMPWPEASGVALGSPRPWLEALSCPSVQVNATLDCDTPGVCFQHVASILVLDGGQPLMTSE